MNEFLVRGLTLRLGKGHHLDFRGGFAPGIQGNKNPCRDILIVGKTEIPGHLPGNLEAIDFLQPHYLGVKLGRFVEVPNNKAKIDDPIGIKLLFFLSCTGQGGQEQGREENEQGFL